MDNIKIAKELVRIAKSLVADDPQIESLDTTENPRTFLQSLMTRVIRTMKEIN